MAVPARHEAPNARYQGRLGPGGSLVGRAPVYDRGDHCPYLLLCSPPVIGNRTLGLFRKRETTGVPTSRKRSPKPYPLC